jgi:hypothetical protein
MKSRDSREIPVNNVDVTPRKFTIKTTMMKFAGLSSVFGRGAAITPSDEDGEGPKIPPSSKDKRSLKAGSMKQTTEKGSRAPSHTPQTPRQNAKTLSHVQKEAGRSPKMRPTKRCGCKDLMFVMPVPYAANANPPIYPHKNWFCCCRLRPLRHDAATYLSATAVCSDAVKSVCCSCTHNFSFETEKMGVRIKITS